MKECALTMREAANLVAFALHDILVNAVKMINVIFINAKIMEHVLSPSLTTFQHHHATAREIMVAQLVTWTCAWTLNVGTELVLKETVSVMKATLIMEIFA